MLPKQGGWMTLNFKVQYLKAIRNRYFSSTKSEKGKILDELCSITGYSRKHAIRILSHGHKTGNIQMLGLNLQLENADMG
mgnify:CR=1 FL=1